MLKKSQKNKGLIPIIYDEGFDTHRYERLVSLGARFDNPQAFRVIGAISVFGDRFDMPNRKHLVARRKSTKVFVPPDIAKSVHGALVKTHGIIGTDWVDCYAFAAAYAGVRGNEVELTKEWILSPEARFSGNLAGTVICLAGDDVSKADISSSGIAKEHWFVPLDDRGDNVINVACAAGPLMICSRAVVEQMYPLEYKFVAEPLVI